MTFYIPNLSKSQALYIVDKVGSKIKMRPMSGNHCKYVDNNVLTVTAAAEEDGAGYYNNQWFVALQSNYYSQASIREFLPKKYREIEFDIESPNRIHY